MTYSEATDFEEKANFVRGMSKSASDVLQLSTEFFGPAAAWTALELGGAGGVLAGMLSNHFRRVICIDIVDLQKKYGGEFPLLLNKKFQRNGLDFDFAKLEFQCASAMDLPYRDGLFDVVYSCNAFEHIPDPLRALAEALRVTKPGGFVYLAFGPIWTASTGNHFPNLVPEPWRHLIVGKQAFCEEMMQAGGDYEDVGNFVDGLNRRLPNTYRSEMPEYLDRAGVARFKQYSWKDTTNAGHPNRAAAAEKLAIAPDDLLIQGFSFAIVK